MAYRPLHINNGVGAFDLVGDPRMDTHDHPVYLTQAEADALYAALGGGGGESGGNNSTTQVGMVQTTDATSTTVVSVPIPLNHTVLVEVKLVARRTGGAAGAADDGATYQRNYAFKNAAGTAVQIGASGASLTMESVATYDTSFAISGDNVQIRVIGVASTIIDWKAFITTWHINSIAAG